MKDAEVLVGWGMVALMAVMVLLVVLSLPWLAVIGAIWMALCWWADRGMKRRLNK